MIVCDAAGQAERLEDLQRVKTVNAATLKVGDRGLSIREHEKPGTQRVLLERGVAVGIAQLPASAHYERLAFGFPDLLELGRIEREPVGVIQPEGREQSLGQDF